MLATTLLAQTSTDVAAAGSSAAAAGIGIGMLIFWILFVGVGLIIWIWALVDVIKRQFQNPNDKTLWIILVILLGWLGAIIYLIVGRKKGNMPGQGGGASTGGAPQ